MIEFVETRVSQFDDFLKKREKIVKDVDDKFEQMARIQELEKELGEYIISVNENILERLQKKKHPIKELFGRYILPYGSEEYEKYRGFNLKTVAEKSLGFD